MDLIKSKTLLESNYGKAETLLKDKDALDKMLESLEEILSSIPGVGEKLANLPLMVSLLRSYACGEYKEAPIKSVVAIASAVIYVVSPFDFIPDPTPGIGFFDDIGVVGVCWKIVEEDVKKYQAWKDTKYIQ